MRRPGFHMQLNPRGWCVAQRPQCSVPWLGHARGLHMPRTLPARHSLRRCCSAQVLMQPHGHQSPCQPLQQHLPHHRYLSRCSDFRWQNFRGNLQLNCGSCWWYGESGWDPLRTKQIWHSGCISTRTCQSHNPTQNRLVIHQRQRSTDLQCGP